MAINRGNLDVSAIFLGNTEVTTVYQGAVEIYSAAEPTAAEFIYTGSHRSGNPVAFVRKYDAVDGTLIWSIGPDDGYDASNNRGIESIAVDANDNVYFCGASFNNNNVYKADSDGNILLSFQAINGSTATAIAVDASANIYVSGNLSGFPAQPNIAKFNSTGTLIWQLLGTDGQDGLAVDLFGDVVAGGSTTITTRKINGVNGSLIWSVQHGSDVDSIAIDISGNVYSAGLNNLVRKYNTDGVLLQSISASAEVLGVAVDKDGNIYTGGKIGNNASTRKFNSAGTLIWSDNHGNAGFGSSVTSIAADKVGNAYTGGFQINNISTRKYNDIGTRLLNIDDNASVRAIATFPPNVSPFLS